MGTSLESESGSYTYLTCLAWATTLQAAVAYGWKPVGSEPPCYPWWFNEDWDGNYTSNDGQSVTAADASALADALDLIVLDPEIDTVQEASDSLSDKLPRFMHDLDKPTLRKLASFCREGYFWID